MDSFLFFLKRGYFLTFDTLCQDREMVPRIFFLFFFRGRKKTVFPLLYAFWEKIIVESLSIRLWVLQCDLFTAHAHIRTYYTTQWDFFSSLSSMWRPRIAQFFVLFFLFDSSLLDRGKFVSVGSDVVVVRASLSPSSPWLPSLAPPPHPPHPLPPPLRLCIFGRCQYA